MRSPQNCWRARQGGNCDRRTVASPVVLRGEWGGREEEVRVGMVGREEVRWEMAEREEVRAGDGGEGGGEGRRWWGGRRR